MTVHKLRILLREAGIDFIVSRVDGRIAHVNVLVSEDKDVHS
jgi:hypothetical protein